MTSFIKKKEWNEIDIISQYCKYNRTANSDGFFDSVNDLKKNLEIDIQEYKPGSEYNYWKIPERWHVNKATLKDTKGNLIADFQKSPLYLWAYSSQFQGKISKDELVNNHIFSNPSLPEYLPFRFRQMFKHWETNWGFSLPHNVVETLNDSFYYVDIDTYFTKDPMITFEYTSPGESEDCIIMFGHWCHPGIVEDGLSGCSVGLKVIDELRKKNHYYTYKFLGIPELIGAVAYLSNFPEAVKNIKSGLGLNFLGRDDYFVLFQSRKNRSSLDTALDQALKCKGCSFCTLPFKYADENKYNPDDLKNSLFGNGTGDEAPFESPGISIPTTSLVRRTPYKEYHTDQDNLNFIDQKNLKSARNIILDAFEILEQNWEPQGRFHGLPCLSSPDLQLFLSPPRDSSIPQTKNNELSDKSLSTYSYKKGKINLHDLSTHLPYMLNSGKTVLELAQEFDLPFSFINKHLLKWLDKNLVIKKPAALEIKQ